MSSRRKLKKQITNSMSLLYADCIFYKVYVVDADKEAADKVILGIVSTHDELLKRVSMKAGKDISGCVKQHFKQLHQDFQKEINAIRKEIEKLGK